MQHRISWIAWVAVGWVTMGSGLARAEFIFDATVPLPKPVETAIERAQTWIAAAQQPNGSWGGCNGVNGMSLMALMVNGHTPGYGRYGSKVAAGVEFLIRSQKENGFLIVGNQGNMYQHAMATLALSEAYGMSHNASIREALIKSVELIVRSQNGEGGWRYQPVPADADLSVTVMQVMALRAVAETGIYVPKETVDLAIRYVKGRYNTGTASYGYTAVDAGNVNRGAAGIVCLQSCGLTEDPTISKTVAYLMKTITYAPGDDRMQWYGHYYSSVALYHFGGDAWKTYYPKICETVLKDWAGRGGHYNDLLNTAWAVLVIGAPYRYLPIYQE